MKHKISLFILALIFFSSKSYTQQTSNCGGSTITNSDFSFEYSIGEISVIPQNTSLTNLSPGITQPFPKISAPTNEIINKPLVVYPNPAKNSITIVGKYNWVDSYIIYSLEGRKVQSGRYRNNSIDISVLSQGNYLIMLLPENSLSYKTVKIIKR